LVPGELFPPGFVSDADFHHLSRVLRLRDGEVVTASDGSKRLRIMSLHISSI
jgi:16S rRNA U1498 N3-methylase RsmE